MVTDSPVDYEAMARSVERVGDVDPPYVPPPADAMPPRLEPGEAQTRGPVIIDSVTGVVRDARTREVVAAIPTSAPERELDLSLVALGLLGTAAVIAIAAALIAPLGASQRVALVALVLLLLSERLWKEIHRLERPEEVPHARSIIGSEDERIDQRLYGQPDDRRG